VSKRAPSTVQLLVITAFALSCFGILLFLWITFGGATPFKAKSYQVKVPFTEASQLAEQSDVRISGVDVGKVESIELGPNGHESIALLNIDDKYGPLPRGTRAMLRTKTLLGETYVELTPGNKEEPTLAEDSTLPPAQVAESVQLDEIFQAFDPETRRNFQDWMQEAAVAIEGQGQNLSYAIGNFEPTFTEFEGLFRQLNSQKLAVGKLFSNGAKTFEALRGREGELADLIESSNELFKTTAARDRDIEALFRAFPTFQDEGRATVERLRGFAVNADPLSKQLVPVAEELSPTLIKLAELAPEAQKLFEALPAAERLAPTGFPALRKLFRDEFPPLLRSTEPFIRNLNPLLTGLDLYKSNVTSFFGNLAAATNGELVESNAAGQKIHFVRTLTPLNPESVASYPGRLTVNRNNAYTAPGWANEILHGLPSFNTANCTAGLNAELDATSPTNPAFLERVKKTKEDGSEEKFTEAERITFAESLLTRIERYAFDEQSNTAAITAPLCRQQAQLPSIYGNGEKTQYQHTFEQTGR
jgi:phospholipid/cholesterol/gamma-HCH transport system substrate-binding protein